MATLLRTRLPATEVVVLETTVADLPAVRVVLEADPDTVGVEAVRPVCRAHLAPYKVPKVIEVRPRLERDENGKVRRALLHGPDPSHS